MSEQINPFRGLEEAIETLENLIEQAKQQSDFYEVDSSFNKWFKDFKAQFFNFKEQNVVVPNRIIQKGKFLERAKILLSNHVIIEREELTELFDNRPSSCCDVHSADPMAYENWICMLREKLLGERK